MVFDDPRFAYKRSLQFCNSDLVQVPHEIENVSLFEFILVADPLALVPVYSCASLLATIERWTLFISALTEQDTASIVASFGISDRSNGQ